MRHIFQINHFAMFFVLIAAFSLCSSGCGGYIAAENDSGYKTNYTKKTNREYSVLVAHKGEELIEATCTYLGKSPRDEAAFSEKSRHNYQSKDTDFYEVTFTNKSSRPLVVQEASYSMDIGDYKGKSSFSSQEIASNWGQSEIGPGKSIKRDTHFVWAVKSKNKLIKTYSFTGEGKSGTPRNFKIAIPLLYQR